MELVSVPAGTFLMGAGPDDPDAGADEKPQHEVYLAGYWIDKTEVSNAMWAVFVADTRHETTADIEGSASVYHREAGRWDDVAGADWRHPEGPASTVRQRLEHPGPADANHAPPRSAP